MKCLSDFVVVVGVGVVVGVDVMLCYVIVVVAQVDNLRKDVIWAANFVKCLEGIESIMVPTKIHERTK